MRKVGRPRIIESPAEMDRLVEEYVNEVPRLTGVETRQSFYETTRGNDYGKHAIPVTSRRKPVAPAREWLMSELNEAQQRAVDRGLHDPGSPPGPLLVSAGAGTGKTRTLVHRVARAVCEGFDPGRILLLTFTRRAAEEMTRRVRGLVRGIPAEESANDSGLTIEWSGTFHAIANRLLRSHARAIGLDPSFTVLDQRDAEDLLDLKRSELGLVPRQPQRFIGRRAREPVYPVPPVHRRAPAPVPRLRGCKTGLACAGLRRPASVLEAAP